MDEYYIERSTTLNGATRYWLMRIPAWAIERAGDAGEWTNDDGDTYVPCEFAVIVEEHATRREAEDAKYIWESK